MHTHYVVTNREIARVGNSRHYLKVNDKEYIRLDGKEISSESIRFGTYSFKNINDEGKLRILKEGDVGDLSGDSTKLPSYKFFEKLYENIQGNKDQESEILVFIHGFKSDLKTSLATVRQLHKRYVENEASTIKKIVLFTWPAMGNPFQYRDDARDAQTSGYAFARGIRKFIWFLENVITKSGTRCNQRIHLMAHSMANSMLEAMVAQMRVENEPLCNLFSDIFMVAADVDYDAFRPPKPLHDLIDFGERVHIFYHTKDRALEISEGTKNAFNRLGRWGTKSSYALPDDVYEYDVTNITDEKGISDELVHHWYYYSSDEVVAMISNILTDFTD